MNCPINSLILRGVLGSFSSGAFSPPSASHDSIVALIRDPDHLVPPLPTGRGGRDLANTSALTSFNADCDLRTFDASYTGGGAAALISSWVPGSPRIDVAWELSRA